MMIPIERTYRQALDQIAEVKRILYATKHALDNQRPVALLVTSALQGEGKSLFSATLAVAAANAEEHRVALLDLNWYRPMIHRFFDLEMRVSIDMVLSGDLADLAVGSDLDNLSVLLAPRDYREEVRESGQLLPSISRIVNQAKESHDLVIVDSGSLFPTNRMMIDPVMLSGITDGVLMVVMMGGTARQQVRRAQKTLEGAGARILGVVSNQWKMCQ